MSTRKQRGPRATTLAPTARQHVDALRVLQAATLTVQRSDRASLPGALAAERAARAAFRTIDRAYVSAKAGR